MPKLLSFDGNAKTVKGQKKGFITGILYLSPADESGISGFNACPKSTPGCRASCLYTAGRASLFPLINQARARKTREYVDNPEAFTEQLREDIRALVRKATREGLTPCVRINGTSDIPKLAMELAREFPRVQFYDYTKIPRPWIRTLPNYHLTFSHSEENLRACLDSLAHGVNVAVVFGTKKGEPLPAFWHGRRVISGDESDLRFLDGPRGAPNTREGIVIGLYAKGRAKKDCTGFVVRDLVQIELLGG